MAPSADRWAVVADDVLAAVVAGYVTAGVELPERQLIAPSLPVWDCELLAVHVERQFSYAGNLASEVVEPLTDAPGFALRGAVIAVHLIRCVPSQDDDGNPPTAAAETAAAETILRDSQLLVNVLVAAVRNGDIGTCNSVAFQEWESLTASGGLGGGRLRMRYGA